VRLRVPPDAGALRRAAPSAPRLWLRVAAINFGNLPLGTTVRDSFTVENAGDAPLLLTRPLILDDESGSVSIETQVDGYALPGNRFIYLVFTCTQKTYGCIDPRIVIRTADGQSDTVAIHSCASAPGKRFGVDTLDFGTARRGNARDGMYGIFGVFDTATTIYAFYRIAGNDFSLVTTGLEGRTLGPKELIPVTLRFAAVGPKRDTGRFRVVTGGGWRDLVVRGIAGEPGIVVSPLDVDFGNITIDSSRDLSFDVANIGDYALTVAGIATGSATGSAAFSLAPGSPAAFTVGPGQHHAVSIRMTALPGGYRYDGQAIVTHDDDTTGPVTVHLHGISHDDGTRIAWLDTVVAPVTDVATLRLHVEPALRPEENVTTLRLTIVLNPAALMLLGAAPGADATGASVTVVRRSDSVADLTLLSTAGLTGERMLELRMRGFTTSPLDNAVAINDVGLPATMQYRVAPGLVSLTGCGVGTISGMTRRVVIRELATETGGGGIVVRYTAPDGARGMARIVGLHGAEILRVELPDGDGTEQTVHIPLERIAPGFYLVQLRVADDVAAAPVMVAP
jgi:hypothetical protein